MEREAMKTAEVLQLAQNFRTGAAETADTDYYRLMLRAAADLEELADSLSRRRLVLADGPDKI